MRIAGMEGEHVEQVRDGIEQLEKLLLSLQTASHDHKTFHSKRVAELMVKIFESVNALDYAAVGNERAGKVMEVFIEESWKSGHEFVDQLKPVDYFYEVVSGFLTQEKSIVK